MVTVHYGLWAKSIQLWPIKPLHVHTNFNKPRPPQMVLPNQMWSFSVMVPCMAQHFAYTKKIANDTDLCAACKIFAFMRPKDKSGHFLNLPFKGVLHLRPKISMFCALSRNYQHLFEKWYIHLIVNCSRNSKMTLEFKKPSGFEQLTTGKN